MNNKFAQGYALLIGVNENSVQKWALPDIARDIAALEMVLSHPDRCAYPADHITTLTGQEATRERILDELSRLQACIRADTSGNATAILYYSGHGWRDESAEPNEYYLIPYDIKQDAIKARALRATDFAEQVQALNPQRLLVVLDCCHAGGMGVKDVSVWPARYSATAMPPLIFAASKAAEPCSDAKDIKALAQGTGRAVLSSSRNTQRSYIRRDGKMSIFTFHLIEALTGHAQPQEGATDVLVSDVISYVSRKVPASAQTECGAQQEPDFSMSGNFPIAILLGGKGLSKGEPAPDPLQAIPAKFASPAAQQINTGGGTYIGGSVNIGKGDFVGRDKIVLGDNLQGDKITVGNIANSSGVAIGRHAQSTVHQGIGNDDLAHRFEEIYRQIEARPQDPNVDKTELAEIVKRIHQEAAASQKANPNKLERWLKTLASMAPDIFEVTIACLTSPLAGVETVLRKVAERVKQEVKPAEK